MPCKIKHYLTSAVALTLAAATVVASAADTRPSAVPASDLRVIAQLGSHTTNAPIPTIAPSYPVDSYISMRPQVVIQPYIVASSPPESTPWVSIAAFLVSLCVAGYTIYKDARARRTSMLDDYWFRKVVGPVTVEPLLKEIQALLNEVPPDNSSVTFSQADIDTFHKSKVELLAVFAVNVQVMNILDPSLGAKVAVEIDSIQDLVIEYCASQAIVGQGRPIEVFRQQITDQLLAVLNSIKKSHKSFK